MTLRWDVPMYWPRGSAVDRWADAELVGGPHDGHQFKVKLGAGELPPMWVAMQQKPATVDLVSSPPGPGGDEPPWPLQAVYDDPQQHVGVWRYTYRGQV